jgi:hypothetical protein
MISRYCSIGLKSQNGIRAILCGFDGDAAYNGSILINCWNNEFSAIVLIGLGNIALLGPNVESTIAYHRDLSIKWDKCAPREYLNQTQWRHQLKYCGCCFHYLFDGDKWRAYDSYGKQFNQLLDYKV